MKRWITVLLCCALTFGTPMAALGEAPALEISTSITDDEPAAPEDPADGIAIDDLPMPTGDDPLVLDDIPLDSDQSVALVVPEEEIPEEEPLPEV